jgi:hypothetical protein
MVALAPRHGRSFRAWLDWLMCWPVYVWRMGHWAFSKLLGSRLKGGKRLIWPLGADPFFCLYLPPSKPASNAAAMADAACRNSEKSPEKKGS